MAQKKNNSYKIILFITGIAVLAMGVVLFFVPPALFPDPANGFNVLRSMNLGGHFNVLTTPDQDDISKSYSEFITWWSPGQYLVPWFFKLTAGLNTGQAMAVTVALCQLCGLAGFYCFFKKIGFTPFIAAVSLVFIVCQLAFLAAKFCFLPLKAGFYMGVLPCKKLIGSCCCLFFYLAGSVSFSNRHLSGSMLQGFVVCGSGYPQAIQVFLSG
jgi:hypothetical protein